MNDIWNTAAPRRILAALDSATGPDRFLDAIISRWLGYTREETPSGTTWRSPEGEAVQKVPTFTKYISDAKSLADRVAPEMAVGVAVKAEGASAHMEGGEVQKAPNAALALCKAVLHHAIQKSEASGVSA